MDMKLEAPCTLIEMLLQRHLGQRYLCIQGKEIVSATYTDIYLLFYSTTKTALWLKSGNKTQYTIHLKNFKKRNNSYTKFNENQTQY